MSDDFKIKIVTEGDARGADRVSDSLGKVTRAAGDNAKASANASRGMNELGEASEKGAAVGRVLGQVMSGNVAALSQLGAALKVTGAALKTNLVGIALIGATALISFLQNLRGNTKEMGDAAAQAAPKVDAFAEALKKAAEAKTDALAKSLSAIKDDAKDAADELERVLRIEERIAKAEGRDTLEEQRRREDLRLGEQFRSAVNVRDRTAEVAGAASGEVYSLEQTLAGYAAQRESWPSRKRQLEAEYKQLQKKPGGTSPEAMARGQRMIEIQAELRSTPIFETPEQKAAEAEQTKRLGPARSAAATAAKEASAAEEALRRISLRVVGMRADGRAIPDPMEARARAAEDRAARRAAGIPEPVDRSPPAARMDVLGSISYAKPDTSDAVSRALMSAGARNGTELAKIMADAVEKMYAAEREKFREQLKALQR